MNRNDEHLNRLANRARRDAPPAGDNAMPPGFATRVLAQTRVQAVAGASLLWERLTLRAVPVAALVLILCALAIPQAKGGLTADPATALANDIFNDLLTP